MRLIGITGAARSGQDTIGDYLRIRHGFTTLSFAAPLKRMICTMLEVSEDWLETHKDEPPPLRQLPRPEGLGPVPKPVETEVMRALAVGLDVLKLSSAMSISGGAEFSSASRPASARRCLAADSL